LKPPPGVQAVSLHFLSKISVFPALITLKLKNSLVPRSNSFNFGRVIYALWVFAGKNDEILRDVPRNRLNALHAD